MNKVGESRTCNPVSKERSYHHGNVRAAIMAAALDALERTEPTALSLRELARTVGVGHSALYGHFRDRTAILAAIAGEGFRALLSDLRAVPVNEDRHLTRLATTYLHFARTRPAYYRSMFLPEVSLPENFNQIEEACHACFETLVTALDVAPTDETREKATAIWSALHGLAMLGSDSGPLHNRIPQNREMALASKIVEGLAKASWIGA